MDDDDLEITRVSSSLLGTTGTNRRGGYDSDSFKKGFQMFSLDHRETRESNKNVKTRSVKLEELEKTKEHQVNRWLKIVRYKNVVQSPAGSPKSPVVTETPSLFSPSTVATSEANIPQKSEVIVNEMEGTLETYEKRTLSTFDVNGLQPQSPELELVTLHDDNQETQPSKPYFASNRDVNVAAASSAQQVQVLCPSRLREGSLVKKIAIPTAPDAVPTINFNMAVPRSVPALNLSMSQCGTGTMSTSCTQPMSNSSKQDRPNSLLNSVNANAGSHQLLRPAQRLSATHPPLVIPVTSLSQPPQRHNSPILIRNSPASLTSPMLNTQSTVNVSKIPSPIASGNSLPSIQNSYAAIIGTQGAPQLRISNTTTNTSTDRFFSQKDLLETLPDVEIAKRVTTAFPLSTNSSTINQRLEEVPELIPISSVKNASPATLIELLQRAPESTTTRERIIPKENMMTFYSGNSHDLESKSRHGQRQKLSLNADAKNVEGGTHPVSSPSLPVTAEAKSIQGTIHQISPPSLPSKGQDASSSWSHHVVDVTPLLTKPKTKTQPAATKRRSRPYSSKEKKAIDTKGSPITESTPVSALQPDPGTRFPLPLKPAPLPSFSDSFHNCPSNFLSNNGYVLDLSSSTSHNHLSQQGRSGEIPNYIVPSSNYGFNSSYPAPSTLWNLNYFRNEQQEQAFSTSNRVMGDSDERMLYHSTGFSEASTSATPPSKARRKYVRKKTEQPHALEDQSRGSEVGKAELSEGQILSQLTANKGPLNCSRLPDKSTPKTLSANKKRSCSHSKPQKSKKERSKPPLTGPAEGSLPEFAQLFTLNKSPPSLNVSGPKTETLHNAKSVIPVQKTENISSKASHTEEVHSFDVAVAADVVTTFPMSPGAVGNSATEENYSKTQQETNADTNHVTPLLHAHVVLANVADQIRSPPSSEPSKLCLRKKSGSKSGTARQSKSRNTRPSEFLALLGTSEKSFKEPVLFKTKEESNSLLRPATVLPLSSMPPPVTPPIAHNPFSNLSNQNKIDVHLPEVILKPAKQKPKSKVGGTFASCSASARAENPGFSSWTYSEEELKLLFSDSSFVMKRSDLNLEVEKLTIWRIFDDGGETLTLKAYEPYSRKGSNRWFHISNWREQNDQGEEVLYGSTIIPENKPLSQVFLKYLPVYVEKICDSPEICVVKLYKESRYLAHMADIYKMTGDETFRGMFTNFVRTIIYQTVDPTFLDTILYPSMKLDSNVTPEIQKLYEGWMGMNDFCKRKCEELTTCSPRWTNATLWAVKTFPKIIFSVSRVDKSRNCDGCQHCIQPLRLPTKAAVFDGLPYSPENLQSYEQSCDKPPSDLQFCHSCNHILKNLHSICHVTHSLMTAVHFRLDLMLKEFPKDVQLDPTSVKEAFDADIDWHNWLLLDFIVLVSQARKDVEVLKKTVYNASTPKRSKE